MPSKAALLAALALYSAVGAADDEAATDQLPPLWTGKSGWQVDAKSIRVQEGTQAVGAVIAEHDVSLQRTGTLKQTLRLVDAAGDEMIIPEGSKAYAINLKLIKDGASVHEADALEWCVVPSNATGRVPETVCIFWEGAHQARYDQYIRTNGIAFQPVQAARTGMPGPMPEIVEGPVDFGVQFKQQLRIAEIGDQGVLLETILSDGTHVSPVKKQKYDWEEGDTVTYKNANDVIALTKAADGKSVSVRHTVEPILGTKAVTVVVELLVGVDGRVKDGRIFKSSGNAYIDEVALKNARETWKMEPATKNGEPVEAWGKFAMTFKIED